MTKRETPRGPEGEKLCAWCGDPIRQSGVGRSRDYCSRTHREYAYRARKLAEIRIAAYSRGRADERAFSSTDESPRGTIPSVDETKVAGPAPVPARAPGGDFLLAPPAATAQGQPVLPDARQAPAPRALSRRRSGMQASAMPLPGLEDADGE